MYALIQRAASASPDVTAVRGDNRRITYRELEAEVRAVASGLRATGLRRVGVVELDALRSLVLLAAGSLLGVELCLYPPAAGSAEIAELAARLDHDVLVSDRDDLDRPTLHYADLVGDPGVDLVPPPRQPVLILTTGTTGAPRGVRHDWHRLSLRALRAEPAPGQRWLLAYGMHQFAGVQILVHVASVQATLVDPGLRRPREGLAAARAHGVTHASATPTFWRFLLAEMRADGGAVPDLRQVTLGGEAVSTEVLDDVAAAFPAARVSQVYAASEFGPTGSVTDGRNGLPRSVLDRDDAADVAMKIVDGELWVRSRVGMLGYHGEEAIADPDGWRATGDLVELVGERVEFRGRAAEIINVGGVKVHPLPVEERVSAVSGVAVSRVYGRPNAMTGSIVAVEVVPVDGADHDALRAAVRDACADLPAASRPRSVRFVDSVATRGHKILRRSDG